MRKRVHFKREQLSPSRRSEKYYLTITVVMKFKKPVCIYPSSRAEVESTATYIDKALADLAKDYPEDIVVKGWFFSATRQVLYVFLNVSRDFAKKNLKYGDYWAPEKYLGRYLSRIARRIRNSDRHFEKYFKDGMFKYSYIYS